MAKIIHTMLRVSDLERSTRFYESVLGLAETHRLDFLTFTLVYLKSPENDFELELTLNKGRTEPYSHGDGYGHLAACVDDLEAEQRRCKAIGYSPGDIKQLAHGDQRVARFFFITDPDGYKLEIIERGGHYV
jgi:lactoylglutathione lyase